MKILSFGEILWDVYSDEKYIGGAPFNFAAHSAKHGEEAYMLSALGNDALGKEALGALDRLCVSHKYVKVLDNKQTGKCLVTLDEKSVPAYNLLSDVAYDYISCENVKEKFDVLYFGTLALRSEYNLSELRKLINTSQFKEIFVDVNIRAPFYNSDTVRFAVENATILKISLEELSTVAKMLELTDYIDYKDFAKSLNTTYDNIRCIIITLGRDGSYAYDCKKGEEYYCGCSDVKVVSTVGAGDSFSAAFLHKYLCNDKIQNCLNHATKVAELVVSSAEAIPDYNSDEL